MMFSKEGDKLSPPLGFEFDTVGEPQKMRKRDAELGSYIGTNCPRVEMLTHTNKKAEAELGRSVVTKRNNLNEIEEVTDTNE